MKFEIKHRYSGKVLFAGDYATPVACLVAAVLARANLAGANLADAVLAGADLDGARLFNANLYGADLLRADLSRADLAGADLAAANLTGANLAGANLAGANLAGANLDGANLEGANLYGANLRAVYASKYTKFDTESASFASTRILPEGDLIGWKKCQEGVVVKLRIPADAKRSHAFGRKCRAEYAEVLEVFSADVGVSTYDGETEYRAGAVVRPDSFDPNWMEECASGIHFFITRAEAEAY